MSQGGTPPPRRDYAAGMSRRPAPSRVLGAGVVVVLCVLSPVAGQEAGQPGAGGGEGGAQADRAAAPETIERLVLGLGRESERYDAQVALLRLGEKAAAAVGLAFSRDWESRAARERGCEAAARVLAEMGRDGLAGLPPIRALLLNPYGEEAVVGHAVYAAERLALYDVEDREHLLQAVAYNPRARKSWGASWNQLVSSLVVDGAGAETRELLDFLADENPYAVVAACRVLAERGDELGAAKSIVIERLGECVDRDWDRRKRLEWTVERVPMYWWLSRDVARWLRTEASLALLELAPDDPRGLLGACQRLYFLDPEVRVGAARWLARRRDPDAVRWLLDAAWDGPTEVSVACLDAVERTGPAVRFEAPRLAALRKHPDALVAGVADRVWRSVLGAFELPERDERTFEVLGSVEAVSGREQRLRDADVGRLTRWLDANGGRNRARLMFDPMHIDEFHTLPILEGGAGPRLRWVPVRVLPNAWSPGKWDESLAQSIRLVVDASPVGTIGPNRERLRHDPFVVELVGVERKDPSFELAELDWLRHGITRTGDRFSFAFPEGQKSNEVLAFEEDLANQENRRILIVVSGLITAVRTPRNHLHQFGRVLRASNSFEIRPGAEDRRDILLRLVRD